MHTWRSIVGPKAVAKVRYGVVGKSFFGGCKGMTESKWVAGDKSYRVAYRVVGPVVGLRGTSGVVTVDPCTGTNCLLCGGFLGS